MEDKMVVADRKYSKTHEWVKVDGAIATVGISHHAQDALGDITFVDLPKPGAKVEKGKECGVIESVKAASDLYSPVSGTVKEINQSLTTAPEAINKEPYGNGWMFKLDKINPADLNDLMDAAAYEKFLETEKD
jgi:glycine cleavage system H protein